VVGPVAGLQCEYSVLARGVEEAILPFALERGLGVIVWSPFASGFLTDGFSLDTLDDRDFRRTHPSSSPIRRSPARSPAFEANARRPSWRPRRNCGSRRTRSPR
jgi:aryl-alcohol dehydrogenase-like predicted oxidoreductase